MENVPADEATFMEDFFGDSQELCVESRSSTLEWCRLMHMQASAILTETYSPPKMTSKQLRFLQNRRAVTKDGRLLHTVLVLGEQLKFMLCLTNPNVVVSTYTYDEESGSPEFSARSSDVPPETRRMCYELATQCMLIMAQLKMPTQPPMCVHGGKLETVKEEEEEEEEEEGKKSAPREALPDTDLPEPPKLERQTAEFC